jgi:hypothetical protein
VTRGRAPAIQKKIDPKLAQSPQQSASSNLKPHLVRRIEPDISWHYAARIEPGEYVGRCRSARVYRGNFHRWTCALQFDILSDSFLEVICPLSLFLNLGKKERPHVGRCSNYWSAWIAANGGPPKRNDRLAPRVFEGRYARVLVDDVTRDHKRISLPPDSCYSIIRKVLAWQGGAK